jgi:GDPmannose 4,6-dehydratase
MTTKTALITGITGQDGSLLAQYLISKSYKIIAPTRDNPDKSNLKQLGIEDEENINFLVYSRWSDFEGIISQYKPTEIYHLAAMSHVGQSHENPKTVFDVNCNWTLELLSFTLKHSPKSRFFFASSCEIYRNDIAHPVTEEDEKRPNNPYGISKLSAHQMVDYYRKVKGLFACNGILFNHESELRPNSFVSKKICSHVARIIKQGDEPLTLGNIEAKKDWGYAPDYVKTIHAILQQTQAQNYNVSTDKLHSVKDMVDAAFSALDYTISWHGDGIKTQAINSEGDIVVCINEKYFRPLDNRFLQGDNTKIQAIAQNFPATTFKQWVKSMTLNEYNLLN